MGVSQNGLNDPAMGFRDRVYIGIIGHIGVILG